MSLRRVATELVLIAMATIVVGVVVPSTAEAHAAYKDSNPADEATVSQPPGEIWAEYTEPVTDGASYMKVFDPCGDQVDNGDSYTQGYRIYVTMSGARAGTYSVDWFAASSIDPHTTRGTFKFTVTEGEPCPGAPEKEAEVQRNRERSGGGGGTGGSGSGAMGGSSGANEGSLGGQELTRSERSERIRERRFGDSGRGGSNRGDASTDVAAPTGGEVEAGPAEPGLFEDIPIGGLALALGLAALIGAAGGFIYAGIMGYTRPTDS